MRFITALAVAAIVTVPSAAQTGFQRFPADAQVRAAAVSTADDALYLAVQDRNEIWKVKTDGTVEAKAPVGKGPVAVAVSFDGRTVAAANRLSNDVSLLSAQDLSLLATVPSSGGPVDVAPLPGGGFAVANSFGDSVTLIDTANPAAPVDLPLAGVPTAVAASESYLAVATRMPPALHLFPEGARTPISVPLPGTPKAVVALPGNRFSVATPESIELVSADDKAIRANRALAAIDLAPAVQGFYALTFEGVVRLDDSLQTLETLPLPESATTLAAGRGTLVAASSQARSWQVSKLREGAPTAADDLGVAIEGPAIAPPPTVTNEPVREPIEIEAEPDPAEAAAEQPAEEPTPIADDPAEEAPEPEAPAEPIRAAEEPEAEPAEEPAAIPAEAATAESQSPVLMEAPPAEKTPSESRIVPPPNVFRQPSLGLSETRAPRTGQRPSAMPLPDFSEPTFGETLRRDLGVTQTEGGFQQPSMEILENIKADQLNFDVDEDQQLEEINAEGSVSLSLDNTDFAADCFYYNVVTGRMDIRGDIRLEQETATLTADEIHYEMPTDEELAAMDPEVVGPDPAARRMSLGELRAIDLEIHEPDREVKAKNLHYDFGTRTGELEEYRGRVGIYYFGGQHVRVLGPASADGEDIWVTTCNLDPPHYRIRIRKASMQEGQVVVGRDARLQLGGVQTPVYWPRWAHAMGQDRSFDFDFDSGHSADIGYYVNFGQRFMVNPDLDLGLRFFPTTEEGVGFGLEAYYDYLETPTSPFYRAKGEVRTLYTTENRGYAEVYHRQDLFDDAILRLQVEQWSDSEFYKDFFYDAYRNRTAPRTFANLTYAQPEYVATATVSKATNGFVRETERLPEVTYHLLERRLLDNLYFTFDTIDGYNEREPADIHALRSVNVARLSYVARLMPALTLTPFLESELSWYSDEPEADESNFRFSNTVGATLQSRFHRSYPGFFGFEGFKHVIVPSVTYSYRPEPTMDVEETPRFDTYDNVYGRSRIESKIDNIVFGRDAESKDVWQVARLTLYQGTDFWNELRKSDDYEVEFDLRPRPYWGWLLAGEHHSIARDYDLDQPYFLERLYLEAYETIVGEPLNREDEFQYNVRYGDYDRLLTYLYYDNRSLGGRLNGRLGYAYTDTQRETFNREVLYGVGYRLGEHWGIAAEHRYDFERGELTRQEYEISRDLHCWEATLQVRERESGWDFGVEFSIKAFPGTGVKF